MSFFNELKRRNVFRVGIAYVVASWLLLQVVDFALDVIDAPNWIIQVLVLLAAIGLPAALTFAWVYEMTPEGLKRESQIQRNESVTAHTAKKLDKLTIALLLAVVVIVIADRFIPETGTATVEVVAEKVDEAKQPAVGENPAPAMPSVAVLPFANMSADPDNEYFSDGISEELLNLLVQVDGLRVPSRTSSFAFKGMNMDIKEIAQKLAVEHILEGSVRKAGNQVRITAQLIDVTTDTHLWSSTYDRELKNIFAIQDEISREIIRELKIALDTTGLLSREASQPTSDMEAYQDYLRGRHFFIQRGVPSLKASLSALQSATSRDPGFAVAWAALSQTAATLTGWDQENSDEYNQIALDAGERALELDDQSATALSGLGLLNYNTGELARSLTLLKQAAELSRDSTPIYFYGLVLQTAGYIEEAHQYLLEAERLDPVYPQLQNYLGINAMFRGDVSTARVHIQRAIEGGNANGSVSMFALELWAGNVDRAIDHLERYRVLIESGESLGLSNKEAQAFIGALKTRANLEEVITMATGLGDATILGYFGAYPEIMTYLEDYNEQGQLLPINLDLGNYLWAPEHSELRQMPEFRKLLVDIGLVELWKKRGWPDLCQPLGENEFECE
mgnify:CR=1 FL=1